MYADPDEDPRPDERLDERLEDLEQQARLALPGYEAQFFNRAGDLCAEVEAGDRALAYYGRAIDAYLGAARYNAAGAVCRKLLRISPGSVRARCTLAWLSIGKGLPSDARWEVDEYVHAAVAEGQGDLARRQIGMMAEATQNPDLRALLADHLQKLGDTKAADRVMERTRREAEPGEEAEALWSRVLRAALMGPDDLRQER